MTRAVTLQILLEAGPRFLVIAGFVGQSKQTIAVAPWYCPDAESYCSFVLPVLLQVQFVDRSQFLLVRDIGLYHSPYFSMRR